MSVLCERRCREVLVARALEGVKKAFNSNKKNMHRLITKSTKIYNVRKAIVLIIIPLSIKITISSIVNGLTVPFSTNAFATNCQVVIGQFKKPITLILKVVV